MGAMQTEPQQEHRWLDQMVGRWTYESEARMGPDQPPMKSSGRETVRSLGGLWVVAEGEGQMPDGSPATMLMTIGYDPKKGRYVGTWIGSMMTLLWTYDGFLDVGGTALTLEAEGPSFADEGKTAKYQDIIRFDSPDHRVFSSRVLGEDGRWTEFMTAQYRRVA